MDKELRDRLYADRLADLDPTTAKLYKKLFGFRWDASDKADIETLLKAGANACAFEPHGGRTFLFMLIDMRKADLDLCRLLAKHGATLDQPNDHYNYYHQFVEKITAREFLETRSLYTPEGEALIADACVEGQNDALREAAELAELIALADAAMVAQEPPRARKRL